MPETASAAHMGREPWRPNLIPLLTLMVATCSLTAYLLVDTYFMRQPTAKYTKDGAAVVLRVKEPLDQGLAIKASGMRLIQTIGLIKQQSDELKTEIAERQSKDQTYRSDLAAFMTQLEDAERMIAGLKAEIAALQQEQAGASGRGTATEVRRVSGD